MSVSLKSIEDDLFETDADVLVNPVNCLGTMGAGLAEEFMNRFPENFKAYVHACRRALLRPGKILPYQVDEIGSSSGPSWIINLATKDNWRNESKIEWVVEGIKHLRRWAEERGISKIACPALGSGLGRLDWDSVKNAIVDEFKDSSVVLDLYPPRPQRSLSKRSTRNEAAVPIADQLEAKTAGKESAVVRKGFKNLQRKRGAR